MEVPRRLSFPLVLPKPASSAWSPLGAAGQTAGSSKDQTGGEKFISEEKTPESGVIVVVEAPPEDGKAARRFSSQDSFSEESSLSEERLEEEARETQRRAEEEEAAAKERAAQRQQLAIQELVESERSYLRLLQLSTVTIRSNLQQQLRVGPRNTPAHRSRKQGEGPNCSFQTEGDPRACTEPWDQTQKDYYRL